MATFQATLADAAPTKMPGRPRSTMIRDIRETIIMVFLVACGVFSIITTTLIVFVLAKESLTFFTRSDIRDAQGNVADVSFWEFITGLQWNPLLGETRNFGIWPLIGGTFMVATIAMMVALPLGLITAIWLSEYASMRVRNVIKPILEIIAGIPTVVFGFFALTFIAPVLRFSFIQVSDGGTGTQPWNPFGFGIYSALAAGIAVGIMCLPIVTSLSEDALRAVPRALREGSYGLGASKFETSIKVIVPAALSGIIAAFLLAIARAVGETMIVALAAGASPLPLSTNPAAVLNPTSEVQPLTGYMVQIFLGDAPHGGVEYYSAYAAAATLFVITLGVTLVGAKIRQRFRQAYE